MPGNPRSCPAWTPTAIRAVLAACAGGDILRRYDEDLDAAFEQARAHGDVTPLVQTVKRWWFEADAWRDPKCSGSTLLASTPTEMRVRRLRNGG
jgi:hypothetical protein